MFFQDGRFVNSVCGVSTAQATITCMKLHDESKVLKNRYHAFDIWIQITIFFLFFISGTSIPFRPYFY